MGMQCWFANADIPEAARTVITLEEDGTRTIHIRYDGCAITANYSATGNWFDIGSGTQYQIDMIRALIRCRIPFNCS